MRSVKPFKTNILRNTKVHFPIPKKSNSDFSNLNLFRCECFYDISIHFKTNECQGKKVLCHGTTKLKKVSLLSILIYDFSCYCHFLGIFFSTNTTSKYWNFKNRFQFYKIHIDTRKRYLALSATFRTTYKQNMFKLISHTV